MRTALILGATGLVGAALLERLASDADYERVTAFVRRPASSPSAKVRVLVVDYDRPERYRDHLAVDSIFCCLGTTIRQAGSQAAFRRVDQQIPLAIANESLAAGAHRYLAVTAVGSNSHSPIFYSRVKGELEEELRQLPFPKGVKIFRPSLLVGARAQPRSGEKIARVLLNAIEPLLPPRYRAITAQQVARAMVNAAKDDTPSPQVYEGARLFDAAGE